MPGFEKRIRPYIHKVSDIVLDPRCPPPARCTPRLGPGPPGTPLQDWFFLAGLAAALLLLTACGGEIQGEALVPILSHTKTGSGPTPAGVHHFFELLVPAPLGDKPVHLLKAKMIGVPKGLVIDGIWGIRFSETGPGYVGHGSGAEQEAELRPYLHRVNEIVLDPKSPPEARCGRRYGKGPQGTPVQDWYLLAAVHSTRPGRFTTKGFEVVAKVGGRTVKQRFSGVALEVNST